MSGAPGMRAPAAGRQPVKDEVRARAAELLAEVRARGDLAVAELTERFDSVRLERSRVDPTEMRAALESLPEQLLWALEAAAANIRAVHKAQSFREEAVEVTRGVRVWRTWHPLRRVGLYVPGGRTSYPSSVLMLAVPARLAGCQEVVVCSPPGKDGKVASPILAAAQLAGVTEVHAIGGVQAIGAMAYGTRSLAPVDKIFGPGNQYVTAAKLLVFGEVAVDLPAGPSEVVVVADHTAPAEWVAADLEAQAEHSPDALAVLATPDAELAAAVSRLLAPDLRAQVRLEVAADLEAAVRFADALAPEHLILACQDAARWLPLVTRAGSLFLGLFSPAAAGDYATGANHVLPTGGAGRSFSALGLADFGRTVQVQAVDGQGIRTLRRIVEPIAEAERLPAHQESVRLRCLQEPGPSPWAPQPRSALLSSRPYQWEPPSHVIAEAAGIAVAEVVRFDTNTSPWAGTALEGPLPDFNEYPESDYRELTRALAGYIGVSPAAITVGAGADEILDLFAKAFIGPGDPVLFSEPSYSMFRVVSELAGASIEAIPAIDLHLDRESFLRAAARARVIWLCNPNNPTGELLDLEFLEQVAAVSAGVVVVDEAYHEFAGRTAAGLVESVNNLAVVRTMSKAFGLAGLRVGCAATGPRLAAILSQVRPPGSVSVLSAFLATQALARTEPMQGRVADLVAERGRLGRELAALGIETRDTATNFVLARAAGAANSLLRRGLVVRTFEPGSPLEQWVRITVRTAQQDDRLLTELALWRSGDGA